MGRGIVWDEEPAPAKARGIVWDDSPGVPVGTESSPVPEKAATLKKAAAGPTQEGAGFRAAVAGALQNFADEAAGKTYEVGNYLRNLAHGTGVDEAESRRAEDYQHGRDTTRQVLEADRKAFPKTTAATGLGGDIATQAVLAAGTGGASLTPGGMAITGGLSGLGASNAPVLSGKTALHVAGGATLGAAAGKVGQKVGQAFEGVSDWAGRSLGRAVGDQANLEKAAATDALNSGIGVMRQQTGVGNRQVELVDRILSDPNADAALVAQAKELASSPAFQQLRNQVYRNTLEAAPEQLAKMQASREALTPLREALQPDALVKATEAGLKRPLQPIVKFAKNYASRTVPPAIGGMVGGLPGAATGAAVGAAMGNPGTAAGNVVRNPAVRKLWWGMLESILSAGGGALGKYGPYLAREYQRNPAHALAIDEALTFEDPEYAATKAALVSGGQQ